MTAPRIRLVKMDDALTNEQSPGKVVPSRKQNNLLTKNSCWYVKLPGENALSARWIKDISAATIVLAGYFGNTTRYDVRDILFVEPVSIEPPMHGDIVHELVWERL